MDETAVRHPRRQSWWLRQFRSMPAVPSRFEWRFHRLVQRTALSDLLPCDSERFDTCSATIRQNIRLEWNVSIDAMWRAAFMMMFEDLIKIPSRQRLDCPDASSATQRRLLFAFVMLHVENSIVHRWLFETGRLTDHKWLRSITMVFDKRAGAVADHRHCVHVRPKLQLNLIQSTSLYPPADWFWRCSPCCCYRAQYTSWQWFVRTVRCPIESHCYRSSWRTLFQISPTSFFPRSPSTKTARNSLTSDAQNRRTCCGVYPA